MQKIKNVTQTVPYYLMPQNRPLTGSQLNNVNTKKISRVTNPADCSYIIISKSLLRKSSIFTPPVPTTNDRMG